MASFDLNTYETVKARKTRFYEKFPDGRICVQVVNDDLEEKAVVKAFVFTTLEDQRAGLAKGTGHALELRDKELTQGKNGKYESVNYSSWLENCEESAVGRALDNAGFASNGKCSRDEMEKAQRNTHAAKSSNYGTPMGSPTVTEPQIKRLFAISRKNGWGDDDIRNHMLEKYGVKASKDLNRQQYDDLISVIEKSPRDGQIPH